MSCVAPVRKMPYYRHNCSRGMCVAVAVGVAPPAGGGRQGIAGQMLCTCWKSATLGRAAPVLPPMQKKWVCPVSLLCPKGLTALKRHQIPVWHVCHEYTGELKCSLT